MTLSLKVYARTGLMDLDLMRLNEGISVWKSRDTGSGSTSTPNKLKFEGPHCLPVSRESKNSDAFIPSLQRTSITVTQSLTDAEALFADVSLHDYVKEVITGPSVGLE